MKLIEIRIVNLFFPTARNKNNSLIATLYKGITFGFDITIIENFSDFDFIGSGLLLRRMFLLRFLVFILFETSALHTPYIESTSIKSTSNERIARITPCYIPASEDKVLIKNI